jgi:methionyl-tRNA formyltransferase
MKIIFLGSGEFGLPTLQRLASEHEVVGVVTSPDQRAGRNRSEKQTAIGQWANEHGLQVHNCDDVNTPEFIETMKSLGAEASVVIAFGQKLSEAYIGLHPTINLHASLLPRWRGAAPINAAVVHGDKETGVSVITLAQQMDAGCVLGQVSTPINETETAGELHDRLALLGPDLVMEILEGDFTGTTQDESCATYAPKLSRSDAILDLSKSAEVIANTIRGYSPWPACHLQIAGVDCKLLRAIPKNGTGMIGELLHDGTIAVGSGSIEIIELKPAGSKMMNWKDFCNGRAIQVGDICEVSS